VRRLALWGAAFLLVGTACVPPVENDKVLKFDPDLTVMGRIQKTGVMRVGISEGPGPFSSGSGETAEGFTVELAWEVARSLGVDLEILSGTDDEIAAMVSAGDVELAFPLVPITEKALSEHSFSDPYWVGHDKILAFDDSIARAADLAGRTVCQSLEPVTSVPIGELAPGIEEILEVPDPVDCPEVDAIVAPDLRLLGVLDSGTLLDEGLTTAGYGAMVTLENRIFATYVDEQILEAKDEGRWSEWFEAYVSPLTGEDPDPPAMVLEEAAALWPAGG
jgi:hypothetical protein